MELYLHSQTYLQGRVFSSAQQQIYFYFHPYDNEQQQNHMQFGILFTFQKVFFCITHTSVGLVFTTLSETCGTSKFVLLLTDEGCYTA